MKVFSTHVSESPCGPLLILVTEDGALLHVEFLKEQEVGVATARLSARYGAEVQVDDEKTRRVRLELEEYFEGSRQAFDLELRPSGTEFQRLVWKELERIPFGDLTSYGEIARTLGRPRSSRAVGRAVGTNPIPVVIPCHRVVGKDRSLTGFGGGLPAKVALLGIEGVEVREGYVR